MILFLTTMIVLFLAVPIYLLIQINSNNNLHQRKILALQNVMSDLQEEQKNQSKNLKLSEELKEKLNHARITIDENIMEFQYDLVAIISKSN